MTASGSRSATTSGREATPEGTWAPRCRGDLPCRGTTAPRVVRSARTGCGAQPPVEHREGEVDGGDPPLAHREEVEGDPRADHDGESEESLPLPPLPLHPTRWPGRRSGVRCRRVETAIVVPVPEADPLIDRWRRKNTTSGAEGMPAHITLIHPFADTSQYASGLGHIVEATMAGMGEVDYSLVSTAYFRGMPSTLYLVPEPPDPFVTMTKALADEFPQYPPYGGMFSEIIPHVTVAQHDDPDLLGEIEQDVKRSLPIQARASAVALFEHAAPPYGWRPHHLVDLA
jgi:hypothetical protein